VQIFEIFGFGIPDIIVTVSDMYPLQNSKEMPISQISSWDSKILSRKYLHQSKMGSMWESGLNHATNSF